MIRAALFFFIFGIVAYALGANHLGGLSIEIGKIILYVFFGIALILFLAGIFFYNKMKP